MFHCFASQKKGILRYFDYARVLTSTQLAPFSLRDVFTGSLVAMHSLSNQRTDRAVWDHNPFALQCTRLFIMTQLLANKIQGKADS
jgi:hypothetical protein